MQQTGEYDFNEIDVVQYLKQIAKKKNSVSTYHPRFTPNLSKSRESYNKFM